MENCLLFVALLFCFVGNYSLALRQGSFSYSFSCNNCSADVLAALSDQDQDALCATGMDDLSCFYDCGSGEYVAAHCACNTGLLFADPSLSYSYDTGFDDFYCCGSEDCQTPIVGYWVKYYIKNKTESELDEYLTNFCSGTECPQSYSFSQQVHSFSFSLNCFMESCLIMSLSQQFNQRFNLLYYQLRSPPLSQFLDPHIS
jgi:hypothetical protein